MQHGRQLRRIILCLAAIAAPATLADAALHSWVRSWEPGGEKLRVYDFEVHRGLKARVFPVVDSLAMFVSVCNSDGFSEHAFTEWPDVSPAWWVSVARAREHAVRKNWHEKDEYDSNHSMNGKAGLKIGDRLWAHGWGPMLFRFFQDTPTATVKKIHDDVRANDWEESEGPNWSASSVAIREMKLVRGDSNRVMHWQPECVSDEMVQKARAVYTTLGFRNDQVDFAFGDGKKNGATRRATRATLVHPDSMLATLRDGLTPGTGKKTAMVVIWGHGGAEEKTPPKRIGAIPNQRGQGLEVASGSPPVTVTLSAGFRDAFFAPLDGDPGFDVDGNPCFTLSTYEGTASGNVAITLDGQAIGNVSLLAGSTPRHYQIELSDSQLQALESSGVFDDDAVDVAFGFATGTFRIATEWDAELDALPSYGIGLATAGVRGEQLTPGMAAPGSGAVVLVAAAMALLLAGVVRARLLGRRESAA